MLLRVLLPDAKFTTEDTTKSDEDVCRGTPSSSSCVAEALFRHPVISPRAERPAMNGIVWALLATCAVSAASARSFDSGAGRQLQENVGDKCPAGCAANSCVFSNTRGTRVCTLCETGLQINRDDGTCVCPEGQYADGATCTTCTKGWYCPGGMYTGAGAPARTQCPTKMTTRGMGAPSIRQCVNNPGTYYSAAADGISNIVATDCPVDTYSRGLRKQRACVPCPPAYTTNGATASTNSSACLVPPGYFVRGPGQIAPCPKGEHKEGFSAVGTCTKCATGVTTLQVGSTSVDACTSLLPSFYAVEKTGDVVTKASKCPQNSYCTGGTADKVACADNLMTQGAGAQSVSECMVPPGYDLDGACGVNAYREGWASSQETPTCQLCGENIFSETNEQVMLYAENGTITGVVWVRGSSSACYLAAGQGMYMTDPTATPPKYRGVDCATNNYGAAAKTPGLAIFPCRDCPANLVTSKSITPQYFSNTTAPDTTTAQIGFTSAAACLTQAGYGVSGRGSDQCAVGTWNAGGNNGSCTPCGTGFTTEGKGKTSIADCRVQIGYGYYNSKVTSCPAGTYNNVTKALTGTDDKPCTPCPTGKTTDSSRLTGATAESQCDQCREGYGGANCGSLCGGGTGTGATYGPARPVNSPACTVCPQMDPGFFFVANGATQYYRPLSLTRQGAGSATQCVAEFAQLEEQNWYLHGNATMFDVAATTLDTCVEACRSVSVCQYITFDYDNNKCQIKNTTADVASGNVLAFKTVQTTVGDVDAQSQGTGQWTYWKDVATEIGTQVLKSEIKTVKACTGGCDIDTTCAAVAMTGAFSNGTINDCKFIKGTSGAIVTKRSLVRAALGTDNTLAATAATPA